MTVIANLNKKPVSTSVELLDEQKNDSRNWQIPEKKVLVLIIFLMAIVIISLGMSFAVVNYPNVSGQQLTSELIGVEIDLQMGKFMLVFLINAMIMGRFSTVKSALLSLTILYFRYA